METILITGASGLIGKKLISTISNTNYIVRTLGRTKINDNKNHYRWNIDNSFIESGCLDSVDHIIHLAGAGIAEKRWTEKRKKEIIDSRVQSANLLISEISKLTVKPKTFISASAIGYYGSVTSEKIFNEDDPPGNDFQAKVCTLWERESDKLSNFGIRTIKLRFGVVLSPHGGALKKMLLPTKFGLGSALGSGKQYFPWVHIEDVIGIIKKAIQDNSMQGAYNTVSSHHVTNKEFSKTLADILRKPFFLPNIPSYILKLFFGEMAQIILGGVKISNNKIIDAGYKFNFDNLEKSLNNLLIKE